MSARRSIGAIVAAMFRHGATVISGLLTIPLVARALGVDGLAAWALLGTTAFALGVADLGLSVSVQRAAARGDEPQVRETVGAALGAVAIMAPLLALGSYAWLLDLDAAPSLRADLSRAAAVSLGAGVIAAFGFPFRALLVVKGHLPGLAWARASAAASQIAVTWVGLAWSPSLLAPAAGLAASALVETISVGALARKSHPGLPLTPRAPTSLGRLRAMLSEGAAAVTINVAAMLALRFDVVVLAKVAPLATVAAYSIAFRAVDQSFTLAKQASTALMPRLANRADRAGAIRVGTALLGGVVASGMAALATRGDGLLIAWAGDAARHPDTQLAVALLAGGAVIAAGHEVVASAITLGGRSAWHAALPLALGYGVNLAVTLAFASSLGVIAVAGGTLVGNLATSLLLWRRGRELLTAGSTSVARLLAPVGVAAIAAVLVGITLARLPWHGLMASALGCAAAMIAGLAAMELARRKLA